MASLLISKVFAVDFLFLIVIFVAKIVISVQTESCLPHVDQVKYWAQVGKRFEVNCTLINCDSSFETPIWKRNGERVRNYRSNQAFFPASKRLKLLIDPVEETDKGEYSCFTLIDSHHQNIELIIGVEPTNPTTKSIPTTTTSPTTSITSTSSSSTSSSTAFAILKVTTTPVTIIKTTQLPLSFNKTKPASGANNSRPFFKKLSLWTSLFVMLLKYT